MAILLGMEPFSSLKNKNRRKIECREAKTYRMAPSDKNCAII
jgi:hypothetical protein